MLYLVNNPSPISSFSGYVHSVDGAMNKDSHFSFLDSDTDSCSSGVGIDRDLIAIGGDSADTAEAGFSAECSFNANLVAYSD